MGTQQLLLIIIGVVVIGIMIAVGIAMFTDNSASVNRDAIANDLVHAASKAQAYWRRPQILGGGGNSFRGFDLRTAFVKLLNENGTFKVEGTPSDSVITISGTGLEGGYDDTKPVKVSITVRQSETEVEEVN
jgi:hypothetical protein